MSSSRRPIMAANWKMNKTPAEAVAFAEAFLPLISNAETENAQSEIVIAPPFTALVSLGEALAGSPVGLAAQNTHAEAKGAFTGEISPDMLRAIGCRYAIVGHSERRTLFGESDHEVARKALALLEHEVRPIVCVGESLMDREAGNSLAVVAAQLQGSLAGIPKKRADNLVVAYEPIWAIGTGKTATPALAQEVHGALRASLIQQFGGAAEGIRIQYGGSVKPENVAELMTEKDIDGALIGGASLAPESFAAIVHFDSGA